MDNFIYGLQSGNQSKSSSNPSPYANYNLPYNSQNTFNNNPTNAVNYGINTNYQNPFHLGGQGPYVIRTKLTGRSLDISQTNDWGNQMGDLIVYNYVGGRNQQFQLQPQGQDLTIRCVKSGKVLDAVYEGNRLVNPHSHIMAHLINLPRVRQNTENGSNGQRWRIQETSPGSNEYYIYCATGKVLDVNGEDGSNNTPVITHDFRSKQNQTWYITPASSTPLAPI